MKGSIYQIYDIKKPDEYYIGSTSYKDINQRFQKHKYASKEKERKNKKLYEYARSVGWDRLKIVVVAEYPNITHHKLMTIEGMYIIKNNPTLNEYVTTK